MTAVHRSTDTSAAWCEQCADFARFNPCPTCGWWYCDECDVLTDAEYCPDCEYGPVEWRGLSSAQARAVPNSTGAANLRRGIRPKKNYQVHLIVLTDAEYCPDCEYGPVEWRGGSELHYGLGLEGSPLIEWLKENVADATVRPRYTN